MDFLFILMCLFYRGFEPQIVEILNDIPPSRQLLLFSATWPKEVAALARSYLRSDAIHVHIGDDGLTANKAISQNIIMFNSIRGGVKTNKLYELLKSIRKDESDPRSVRKVIIFCQKKADCDFLAEDIAYEGYSVASLHGDKSQSARDDTMMKFRRGRKRVLVATDIAARGLDISDVEVVINYDFPNNIEDYVHRIGRTARGERSGASYTFFTSKDDQHAKGLLELLRKSEQDIPTELQALVASKSKIHRQTKRNGYRSVSENGKFGAVQKKGKRDRFENFAPAGRRNFEGHDNNDTFDRNRKDRHASTRDNFSSREKFGKSAPAGRHKLDRYDDYDEFDRGYGRRTAW